jgi:hypothetical protein
METRPGRSMALSVTPVSSRDDLNNASASTGSHPAQTRPVIVAATFDNPEAYGYPVATMKNTLLPIPTVDLVTAECGEFDRENQLVEEALRLLWTQFPTTPSLPTSS